MRILIGGGTGFIGRHLSSLLKQKGHQVTLISRTVGENKVTWDEITNSGLPGCDAVVNLAGASLDSFRWNDDVKNVVRQSRIGTTKQLAKAISCSPDPPRVFITSSGVGYYEPSTTEEYDEDSPGRKSNFMSKLCVNWEEAAVLPATSEVRRVVIRIGVALGVGGGLMKAVYWPFYFGLGGKMGTGQQWLPWIHVNDVAGIITHAIERDDVQGVLNATSPATTTNGEFTKVFARAMSRPSFVTLPAFVVNCMLTKERGAIVLTGQNVKPRRTLESGYKFQFDDLKSACEDCLSSS